VLLAKTLTSSTFRLALIAIGAFGVIVSAIFSYVYLSTSSYVRSRSDRAIVTEYLSLQGAYERSGRDGLIALIRQRMADKNFADNVYLLVDRSLAPLGGNLRAWPSTVTAARGWVEFRALEPLPDAANRPLVRGMLETFPSGDRLLVGRDISELDGFAEQIKTAVISGVALIFVIAGVTSILVTRRTVGRIEQINATSRAIMQSGLDQRIPLRGSHDEWDRVAENLNLMLDRIETLMGEVKQVSDNVAHDLRTPLTRMRGRLEKAYDSQRSGEADQTLIGDTLADLRVAFTGTNPRPVRLAGTAALCGGALDDGVLAGLDALVRDQIMAMKTTFTPGHYRRRVAGVLARRLVQRLFAD